MLSFFMQVERPSLQPWQTNGKSEVQYVVFTSLLVLSPAAAPSLYGSSNAQHRILPPSLDFGLGALLYTFFFLTNTVRSPAHTPTLLVNLIHTIPRLDKLPFKESLLNPVSPLIQILLQLYGWGRRKGKRQLNYELLLTHVYNFHKFFCNTKGGERDRSQALLTLRKPAGRTEGRLGKGGERQWGKGGRKGD